MKTIFRLLCGLMAIALTTACSHEELLPTEPVQKPAEGKMVSVKAYTPSEQPASRLAFDDQGTEGLKLSWSEGDAFTAVVGNDKVTFTYNANTKEFSGTLPDGATLTDGLNAYYPAYTDEYVKDFSTQTGALNSATTYMEGAYDATAQAFRFNHSTAILKVAFSGLPQNAEIESISIDINNASIIAINDVTGVDMNSVYFNLPALAKDSKLVFYVETTAGLYTATKTVTVEEGIKTGVYYNTTVALQEACLLPEGIDFNNAISVVDGYGNATSIVFEANVADETPATRSDSNYTIALAGNVLTISTPLSEFVFNADCNSMFASLSAITAIDFNNCINTANVTIMDYMFNSCNSLTSLDLSSFNTANVMSMANMFDGCSLLSSLDLSSFNTENVMSMDNMFYDCSALSSLDLSSFNTENVTNMSYMFNKCFSLTSLNVSSFNTSNVMYMNHMFNNCSLLTSLDLSNFNFDKVQYFESMFTNLGSEVTNKPIPVYVTQAGYDILMSKSTGVNGSNAEYALACELLTGSSFNSAVNSFLNGKSLTKIKFVANSDAATTKSDANDENATEDYSYRLVADSDNETLEIHTAAPKFVFNADCFGMFASLFAITAIDFNNCINTSNVTNMGYMFYGCSALESLDLSSFNTSNVEAMNNIFYGCSMLSSLDLSSFNTANVEYMYSMFNNCSSLQSITFGNSFNTSNVTNMGYMFYGCSALESLDLSSFNTSNVMYMNHMFNNCSALESLDLSSFNTEKVTDMNYMFNNCSSLTSLDLRNFNTSKVTTMDCMFYNCFSISELKLINFDFRNVDVDDGFDGMFTNLASNNTDPVAVYVYVTQDSYNILKNKVTGINSNYAWFVNEEGTKYGN